MALGVCRECGKEVSSEAKTCPHCGVKQPVKKSNTGCLVALGILVVVLILGSIGSHSSAPTSTSHTPPVTPSSDTSSASQATTPSTPATPWSFYDSTDEMRGAAIQISCTTSIDEVHLGFPYENQHVELCVRKHPRFGEDVYVRLENEGQFLCNSYNGCAVRVRFDDGAVSAFSAAEPSDNSTNVIFVTNHTRFIQNLKHASRVVVEAEFYQDGVQQMTFDTNGFVWPRPANP